MVLEHIWLEKFFQIIAYGPGSYDPGPYVEAKNSKKLLARVQSHPVTCIRKYEMNSKSLFKYLCLSILNKFVSTDQHTLIIFATVERW